MTQTAEGTCEGFIALEPKGDNGFGYDPVFYLPEYDKTIAELPPEIKNRISHRGRAAAKARLLLADLTGANSECHCEPERLAEPHDIIHDMHRLTARPHFYIFIANNLH